MDFPLINSILNATTFVLLLCGFFSIKSGREDWHRKFMVSALLCSVLFLTSYLYYHITKGAVTKFSHQGLVRVIYFVILISHTILAMVNLPMVILTFTYAIKGNFKAHKKVAPITLAIWLYVSVTGVLVYLMLYIWFP